MTEETPEPRVEGAERPAPDAGGAPAPETAPARSGDADAPPPAFGTCKLDPPSAAAPSAASSPASTETKNAPAADVPGPAAAPPPPSTEQESAPAPAAPPLSGTEPTAALGPSRTPRFCKRCGKPMGPAASASAVCPACKQAPSEGLVGKVLEERYEVVRKLGEGAMGTVYEVRHLRLEKRFAMKVIHAELARIPEFVARFEREALSCSRLSHPNTISVTDFGRAATGELFLVMEFVEGQSIQDLVRERPLPVGRALETTRQVLLALQHAHQASVVHRDIKPENVMQVRTEDGSWRVKVLDFGIARAPVAEGEQLTQAGVIFGTPEYMAPEQAMSASVDARADLYAVGAMLWRMLTARPIFPGQGPVDALTAKLSNAAPTLESVAPGVYSSTLGELLRRALERRPAERFQSAEEMLEALARVQGELGRGLAIRPRSGFWAGLLDLPRQAGRLLRDWYRCTGASAPPSHGLRLRSLVTTSRGHVVLTLGVILVGLLFAVPLILVGGSAGDPPIAAPTIDATWIDKLVRGGSGQEKRPKHAPRKGEKTTESPNPTSVAERLVRIRLFLDKSACREAMVDLKNLLQSQPALAEAHYLLGAAQVCRRYYREGLEAYAEALRLEPGYRTDARILEDCKRLLKVPKVRLAVVEFLGTRLGEAGLPLLLDVAGRHPTLKVRHRAIELATSLGAADRVDRVSSLTLDLAQLPTCEERARVVDQLAQLGDPRAIEPLREARDATMRVGFIGWSKAYKNQCCRARIIAVIKQLSQNGKGTADDR